MKVNEYIDRVLEHVEADTSIKRRLREDLYAHIMAAGGETALPRMGDPRKMAVELMDGIYDDRSEVIRELVRTRAAYRRYNEYEYVSKAKLFGMPLVHIHFSGRRPFARAKGFIAIGNIATGAIAIGAVATGIISFGAVCVGLLALGSVAVGLLVALGAVAVGALAIGGVAVGLMAWGGLAVGLYAFGGAAIASRIAVGGYANGVAAIGGTAKGIYTIATGGTSLNTSAVSASEARELITRAFPDTWGVIVRSLTLFFR